MYQLELADKVAQDTYVPKQHWLFKTKKEAFDQINSLAKNKVIQDSYFEGDTSVYYFKDCVFTITVREDLAGT